MALLGQEQRRDGLDLGFSTPIPGHEGLPIVSRWNGKVPRGLGRTGVARWAAATCLERVLANLDRLWL